MSETELKRELTSQFESDLDKLRSKLDVASEALLREMLRAIPIVELSRRTAAMGVSKEKLQEASNKEDIITLLLNYYKANSTEVQWHTSDERVALVHSLDAALDRYK